MKPTAAALLYTLLVGCGAFGNYSYKPSESVPASPQEGEKVGVRFWVETLYGTFYLDGQLTKLGQKGEYSDGTIRRSGKLRISPGTHILAWVISTSGFSSPRTFEFKVEVESSSIPRFATCELPHAIFTAITGEQVPPDWECSDLNKWNAPAKAEDWDWIVEGLSGHGTLGNRHGALFFFKGFKSVEPLRHDGKLIERWRPKSKPDMAYRKTDPEPATPEEKSQPSLKCSGCGSAMEPSWKVCPKCAKNLKPACAKCGKELEASWVACPACGEKTRRSCSGCSKALEPDWKVCPNCGK